MTSKSNTEKFLKIIVVLPSRDMAQILFHRAGFYINPCTIDEYAKDGMAPRNFLPRCNAFFNRIPIQSLRIHAYKMQSILVKSSSLPPLAKSSNRVRDKISGGSSVYSSVYKFKAILGKVSTKFCTYNVRAFDFR